MVGFPIPLLYLSYPNEIDQKDKIAFKKDTQRERVCEHEGALTEIFIGLYKFIES
jgi:hypothetical protein